MKGINIYKSVFLVMLSLALNFTSFAQQQTMYSNYVLNGFAINPAIAGSDELAPLQLSVRQQWVGIDQAPQTQFLSGHTSLGRNQVYGAGGLLYHDAFGPISRTGITGAFSYRFKAFGSTILSFGLSFSAFQFSFDNSDVNIIDNNDQVFTGNRETSIVPDANFGIYLYNNKYFVSLSSTQLLQLPMDLGSNVEVNKSIRHYYLYGGYKFKLNENFDLEPSLMFKITEQTPFQIDINLKAYFQKKYWLAVSYRHQDAIIGMLGLKIDRYSIAYAYDYNTSLLHTINSGSHELVLRFDLSKKQKSSSLL
jgi:type IX secretion system PorP/SprF family membrane protein